MFSKSIFTLFTLDAAGVLGLMAEPEDPVPPAEIKTLNLKYHEQGPRFTTLIQLGTKPKSFDMEVNLNFDNLIFTDENCEYSDDSDCDSGVKYDLDDSDTSDRISSRSRSSLKKVDSTDNSISVEGYLCKDVVCFGPSPDDCFKE